MLYSGLGVLAMFLILVAVGVISGQAKVRLDLTQEKLYTLSAGTRRILSEIKTPIQIHFFCTQSSDMPESLKNYAREVEDLLYEYREASNGKIIIKKYDPEPDSDAEDLANMDGVQGQALSQSGMLNLGGEKVYLGLAVVQLDRKSVIPFLDPAREKLLEYDVSRAISEVLHPNKPVLGVMSALPVFGQFNPMMQQGGGQQPWVAISELKRDFTVTNLDMNVSNIADNVKVLLMIDPSKISDQAQYAVDQFLMRGGRLIALLDPLSVVQAQSSRGNMMQRAANNDSSLPTLLKAWGLKFDVSKVLADRVYATMVRKGSGQPVSEPTWLTLNSDAIDQKDVVTSQLDNLLLVDAGVFTGTPVKGLKEEVLLHSSRNSMLEDKMMAQFGGGNQNFDPAGKQYALAVRLTGKFKTAFPDGPPASASESTDTGDKSADAKKAKTLKESKGTDVVLLVGDSDFIYDHFCVRVGNFLGQQIVQPFNGNLSFLQNMVEQMMGDVDLIAVRTRGVQDRPFTVVKRMQAKAQEQYRQQIKDLQDDLQQTQQKLQQLQQAKGANQDVILSNEQQAEIKRFRHKEAQTRTQLRNVRKKLRKDIDSLENRIKWIDIAGMPFFVTVLGVGLAFVKRKKTAAK